MLLAGKLFWQTENILYNGVTGGQKHCMLNNLKILTPDSNAKYVVHALFVRYHKKVLLYYIL